MLLSAGHRHGVIEQYLVGDVGVGVARPAQRQDATVIVSAVAQILEHMAAFGKWCLANPVRPLAAHLGKTVGAAVHPQRHVVAADAGIGARPRRNFGGGIMRAARAEIRDALPCVLGLGQHRLRLHQPLHAALNFGVGAVAQQALADADGNVIGVKRALDRKQPLILLVLLAHHNRRIGHAVELFAHLHFNQRALFLNDNDHVEALRELFQPDRLQRPGAADLVQPQAKLIGPHLVNAKVIHRLAYIEIGLAAGDDADFWRAPAGNHDAVELVGAHKGQHCVALVVLQPRFLRQNWIGRPDI